MDDCVFCRRIAGGEWDTMYAGVVMFEPLNPVTPGHRLFVPQRHVERADDEPSLTGQVFTSAAYFASIAALSDFNLIINSGPDASQTVRHLHVHFVPRRPGDGLVLPWTAQKEAQVSPA